MGNKNLASLQKAISEFMKDLKNKMREWWGNMCTRCRKMCTWWENIKFNYPKTACLLQYGGLALVILVVHFVSSIANIVYFRYPFDDFGYPFNFSYPLNEIFRHSINVTANLTSNNATTMYAENARSILCTLVGSEAAIVAIVVSLTLIAIKFTASEYSPRVIDISLKNPDMWILLLIYGISIFYSIVLIKQVPHDYMIPFEDVSFAFWLGVFSYVALVPYLRNIIRLLKPENIIKKLAIKITSTKILNNEEDLIQPIMDIVRASIMKYDFETMRVGLIELSNRVSKIIDSKSEKKLSKSFCDHLESIGKFAISRADEESSRWVIINLGNFGKKSNLKTHKYALKHVVFAVIIIGKNAVGKKGLKDPTQHAASTLAELRSLSKEIVEAVIHEYESGLEGEDLDDFQNFKKVYEEELKKRGKN